MFLTNVVNINNNFEKFFSNVFVTNTLVTIKNVRIIAFNVDFNKNVETDQEFRDWSYTRINVAFFFIDEIESIYLNIEINIIFSNKNFFKNQASKISIRKMIFSISVRDVKAKKHQSNEYVIVFIYIFDRDKNENVVKIMIIKKIHLIDNFKINMLFEIDLIESKKIDISVFNKTTYIDNCDVIASLKIKTSRIVVRTSMYAWKIIVVSSYLKITLSIHYIIISTDKNYIFESNELNVFFYAHLIDVNFKHILIRNDNVRVVHIFRNCRMKRMTKINFFNAFQIHADETDEVAQFVIRRSIKKHKTNWFKKIIVAIYAVTNVLIDNDLLTTFVNEISSTVISASKIYHNSTLSQRKILFKIDVKLSNVFYSCYQSTTFNFTTSEILDLSTSKIFDFLKSIVVVAFEIIFDNDVIIHHFNDEAIKIFNKLIEKYFDFWKNIEFVVLSKKNWMRIFLKSDWEQKISDKIKIYFLNKKNREFVNETFDKLHESKRLNWTKNSTSFSYSVFCVWKNVNDEMKKRSIINIRDLNNITQSNVYSLSLQFDIIFVVLNCQYIIVVNCFAFFYQWRVHSNDKHKLIVVTHKKQKIFNVVVMKYKNSSTYVQRQIDRLLRSYRNYVKTYVNDIVIHFKTLSEHLRHFRDVFDMFKISNIFIKSKKTFIDYLTIHFLKQKIDFFDLTTAEKKLKIIFRLFFSVSLQLFEIYLEFIDWLRDYVSWYVDLSLSLQKLKTKLFREKSVADNVKKIFSRNIKIKNFTIQKIAFFESLQFLLTKFFYFVHVDFKRKLFVDFDFNKKFDFVDMIYHVKEFVNWDDKRYSSRKVIKSIFFLSRLLIDVETRYWFTKLKLVDIVWVFKKIRHFVDFSKQNFTIIFTNHDVVLEITKQINMITTFTNKFNFRFVRVFDYIQRFDVELRHKSNKQHIVSNALSRLVNINIKNVFDEKELNVFFTTVLMKVEKNFRRKLIVDYVNDFHWKKIFVVLNQQNKNAENSVKLSFYKEINELIFRSNEFIIENHVYESRRFCVSHATIENVFVVAHDDNHFDFARCYEKISTFYYIHDLFRFLRDYLNHYFKCQTYQTRRHKSYEFLQSILTSTIFFHIITIDFILTLSISLKNFFDCAMSCSCKHFKRIILILNQMTWIVVQWKHVLLNHLNLIDWEFSKTIIFDRDRKFLSNMWKIMFTRLKIALLYSVAYHSQTNDLSKKINQIIEIAFRFLISTLKHFNRWLKILSRIRRDFNNFINVNIDCSFNEIIYDFSSITTMNLWKSFSNQSISVVVVVDNLFLKNNRLITRLKIVDVIVFDQMNVKFHYDRKHQSMFMKQKNHAFIKFHKKYNIFFVINRKYDQQYVEFFLIIEKIERFAYRFVISNTWRIHFVFNITQLKFCFSSTANFFNRFRSNQSNFVYVDDDTTEVKFFELFKIINKRQIKIKNTKYFVQWKNYDLEHDVWKNLLKLKNVMNLVQQYENVNQTITTLFERFQLQSQFSTINNRKYSVVSITKLFAVTKTFVVKKLLIDSDALKKRKMSTFVTKSFVASIMKSFVASVTKFSIASVTKFFFAFVSTERSFVVVISSSSSPTFDFEKFSFFIALIRRQIWYESLIWSASRRCDFFLIETNCYNIAEKIIWLNMTSMINHETNYLRRR